MRSLLSAFHNSRCSSMSMTWQHAAGVYDALKQKYLKCLLFGISEDEGGSCLMEVSTHDGQLS